MLIDFENGDNIAVTNDMPKLAKLSREFNKLIAEDKIKLQNIINSLGG